MTTTTDEDLRDLLAQTDMTAAQIDECMANPDAREYAKAMLDVFHKLIAERLAERLIERMFPEGVGDEQVRRVRQANLKSVPRIWRPLSL